MKNIFRKTISDFKKIDKKSQVFIIIALVLSFSIGVVVSISYKNLLYAQAQKKLAKSTPPTPIPALATAKLVYDKNKVDTNSSFIITLLLDSPNQGVEAADFVVRFDPEYLKVEEMLEGKYFKEYPIFSINEGFVKISGIASLEENNLIIPKGKGEIGKITFIALAPTEGTTVEFDKNKTIVASKGKNILDTDTFASVSVEIR